MRFSEIKQAFISAIIVVSMVMSGCDGIGGLGPLSGPLFEAASDQQVPIGGNQERLVILRTTLSGDPPSNLSDDQQSLEQEFELVVIDLRTGAVDRIAIEIDDSITPVSDGDFAAWVPVDDTAGGQYVTVLDFSTMLSQRYALDFVDGDGRVLDMLAVDDQRVVMAGGSTQPTSLIVLDHESGQADVFDDIGPTSAEVLSGERLYFFNAQGFSIPPEDEFDVPPVPVEQTTDLIEFDLLTGQRDTILADVGEVGFERMRVESDRLLWLTFQFGDNDGGSTTSVTVFDTQTGLVETLIEIESEPTGDTDPLESVEDFSTLGVIVTSQRASGLFGIEFSTRFVGFDGREVELFDRSVGLGNLEALHEPFPRIFGDTVAWRDPATGEWIHKSLSTL